MRFRSNMDIEPAGESPETLGENASIERDTVVTMVEAGLSGLLVATWQRKGDRREVFQSLVFCVSFFFNRSEERHLISSAG